MSDDIKIVTVVDPGLTDATVLFPGQHAATQKRYKYAISGMELSAGERAYAVPVSGEWVLLGGAVEGGGGGGLPGGGNINDALVKRSAAARDAIWSPLLYRGEDGGLCEIDEL